MEIASATLFRNANAVLDGFAELRKSVEVLVEGSRIVSVSRTPLRHEDAHVIDVAGKTLMPGLIDAHAHITGLSLSPRNISYPSPKLCSRPPIICAAA